MAKYRASRFLLVNKWRNIEPSTKRMPIMMRPTIAISGITEAKRRARGPMSESNIIAAHPDKRWLKELILSQLANADSGTTQPSAGWTRTRPASGETEYVLACKFST